MHLLVSALLPLVSHSAPAADAVAAARDAVSLARPGLRSCYDAALRATPDLEGRLVLEVALARDATVREARVATDELGSAAVATCALEKVRALRFPAALAGATARLPFVFAPTRTLAVLPFENLAGD